MRSILIGLLLLTATATSAQTVGAGGYIAGPPGPAGPAGPTYTDAQAIAAAQGITAFSSPNIAMPNGGYIAHTIYQSRPSGGSLTIAGTTRQSIFASTGDGSMTIQPVAMFVGARFHEHFRGTGATGIANVSTITADLKIGSTTLLSGTTLGLPASASAIPFWGDVECKILSTGTTGTMLCYGSLSYGVGTSSATVLTTSLGMSAPIVINTTIAQTWDGGATLSSTIGTPSLTIYDAYIIQEN